MGSSRYRFILVDESAQLPVVYWKGRSVAPPPPAPPIMAPVAALLDAFAQLGRRGPGERAWAAPLADNPLSFLLDSMSDAVLVRRRGGPVLYRNRAASRLPVLDRPPAPAERVHIGVRTYERRCLLVEDAPYELVIEVLSPIHQEERS